MPFHSNGDEYLIETTEAYDGRGRARGRRVYIQQRIVSIGRINAHCIL